MKAHRCPPRVLRHVSLFSPALTLGLVAQIVTVKHSTLWQHPKYFFHKAPPRPVNVTETEKPAVKTVKKSWGQVNPDAAGGLFVFVCSCF